VIWSPNSIGASTGIGSEFGRTAARSTRQTNLTGFKWPSKYWWKQKVGVRNGPAEPDTDPHVNRPLPYNADMGKAKDWSPQGTEAILKRIAAIEAEMVGLQQRAVLQGLDLRLEWDVLIAEIAALKLKL
jgi:hypothetical protein